MKQYCRYCVHCFYGDVPYCGIKRETLTDRYIKRVNNCPDYEYTEAGDVETGKPYRPREYKPREHTPKLDQLTF